jgi:poly-gamma-glutamate capsule biosynthesis protein CapA/YwtB (metallophosphatase superfamily)
VSAGRLSSTLGRGHRGARGLVLGLVIGLAGCTTVSPSPQPTSNTAPGPSPSVGPAPSGTPLPSPTAGPTAFPLAVVTGITNLKATTTLAELAAMRAAGTLLLPCGVSITAPPALAGSPTGSCTPADAIAGVLARAPLTVALLPPGLVKPTTKVLPIGGDGPYGLGGADLFGAPEARGQPYPIVGESMTLLPAWTTYDRSKVWTLISLGDTCPDRGVAYAAITQGLGWSWVLGGGTAKYQRIYPNPAPPNTPGSGELVVAAVATGHAGAVARLVSGADVTIDDFECPIVDHWRPNLGTVRVFTVDPKLIPLLRTTLGIDVAYLASNHLTDAGVTGIRSTLHYLDASSIVPSGLGMNLAEALRPAFIQVGAVKLAFVSFNAVPGTLRAGPSAPGVAWLTRANVFEAVKEARAGGAQVVFCDPQWWGGAEYHSDLKPGQRAELTWFDAAGCDQVVGAGTHLAGPLLLRTAADGKAHLVMASHGNYLFGQDWAQTVQEGVILELAFRGTDLVNVRVHPYFMLRQAQASLIDPQTDGRYVLGRLWKYAEIGP